LSSSAAAREAMPDSFLALLEGANFGKKLVRLP